MDSVTCPLWPKGECHGRRYRPYFGNCNRCGIKIALDDETKRRREKTYASDAMSTMLGFRAGRVRVSAMMIVDKSPCHK
jgi:hypothetical protein